MKNVSLLFGGSLRGDGVSLVDGRRTSLPLFRLLLPPTTLGD